MKRELTTEQIQNHDSGRVSCDECGSYYEDNTAVKTLVVNPTVKRKHDVGDRTTYDMEMGGTTHNDVVLIEGVHKRYCKPCLPKLELFDEVDEHDIEFAEEQMVEELSDSPVDTEYYVCDRCTEVIGQDLEYEVYVNPRVDARPSTTSVFTPLSYELNTPIKGPNKRRLRASFDEEMHFCDSCATTVFDLGTTEKVRKSLFGKMKGIF